MTNRKPSEFDNFDRTMTELLKVSHSELRGRLDAEKKEKAAKKAAKRATMRTNGKQK